MLNPRSANRRQPFAIGTHCQLQRVSLEPPQLSSGAAVVHDDLLTINLGRLVRETEDDMALVECFEDRDCLCVIEPVCVLRKALHQALGAFFKILDGYTIADLLKPSRNLARLLALP